MKTDLQISHDFKTHTHEEAQKCDDCQEVIKEYKEAIQSRQIQKVLNLLPA